MDEAVEAVDSIADIGLEGVLVWALRLLGLLALFAGPGLWLVTDMGILFVPALLLLMGVVLLVAPSLLLALVELAG